MKFVSSTAVHTAVSTRDVPLRARGFLFRKAKPSPIALTAPKVLCDRTLGRSRSDSLLRLVPGARP